MWDDRYSSAGYAYGTAPNDFLRQHLARLPLDCKPCTHSGAPA